MSKDLKTLLITAPSGVSTSPFLYQYDVKARTWSTDNAPAAQTSGSEENDEETKFILDPALLQIMSAIWYIGGVSNNGATETNEIDKFLNGSWNANIPVVIANGGDSTSGAGSTTVMNKYSAGTSHLYGSRIYLFGGFASGNGPRSYQNFQNLPWIDISTSPLTIGAQLTLGPTPSPRQNHCSVLTESKKVIIFGGYDAISQTTLDDMWSLDLITLTWQQIFPLNLPQPRYGHTCNIIGANMIVYGGRASFNGKQETGFFKDTQVFDVVRVTWMSEYTPKDDTTPISKPLPGGVAPGTAAGAGGARSGALSTGGVIGIVVAVLALIGIGLGLFVYRKRQRRLEIREAEMEKEAYLASLGSDAGDPENDPHHRRNNHRTHRNNPYAASAASPHSASTRRLNGGNSSTANTPGMSHYGLSGVDSPTMGGHDDLQYSMPSEAPGNVQYLMQQLPDGTIAVQPVYLDHRPASLQHSPNMVYSETSSLGGFLGQSATSNPGGSTAGGSGGAGYIAPLSPANIYNNNATSVPGTTPGYVPPPSSSNQHLKSRTSTGTIPFSAPTHDPFASPVLNQSPAQWNSNASTPSSPTS
ncbi:Negative regulator of mitotic exit [Mortierella claussenii]|nr:Negative regulator of mitotic exit [Mortierella claussenii]